MEPVQLNFTDDEQDQVKAVADVEDTGMLNNGQLDKVQAPFEDADDWSYSRPKPTPIPKLMPQ